MRHRQRSDDIDSISDLSYRVTRGVQTPMNGSGTYTWHPSYEDMLDVPGKWDRPCHGVRTPLMKPVTHEQWKTTATKAWVYFRYNLTYDSGTYAPAIVFWINNFQKYPDTVRAQQVAAWSSSATSTSTDIYTDLWNKCRPTLSTRANLSVFLWELRDLKRMFEILPSKYFHVKDWKELFRYLNGQHLNFNFGWKPFINDVTNVMNGLSSFEARLTKYLREAGHALKKHGAVSPVETETTQQISSSASGLHAHVTIKTWKQFRSTFEFRYTLPGLDYQSIRWRAYLDTLGLQLNWKTIWEILPWSFVVDWFVNVGSFLDRVSEDWLQPWIYMCQSCTSVDYYAQYKAVMHWYEGNPTFKSVEALAVDYHYFARSLGHQYYGLTPASLDPDKIRLLVSLVGAKLV